jgi:hypothetical protein
MSAQIAYRCAMVCVFSSVLTLLPVGPCGAQAPKIASFQPPRDLDRSLVSVKGEGLESGVVVWDAGLASERKLAPTVLGATMFSVPPKSSIGVHPIVIESPAGRSAPINFTVTGPAACENPEACAIPRLDGVTLMDTKFEQDGMVRVILYVQGANIDVGAKVLIDGVETASSAHKAIYSNVFGADPKTLGYPIRHYLSRIVPLASKPRGSNIIVKIVNEAGENSNEITYTLPEDPKKFSSAGDGIFDDAKLNGYDNGTGKIDLKLEADDLYRKIIFVQVDIMEGVPPPITTSERCIQIKAARGRNQCWSIKGTFDTAQEMFANAPILNPYGPNGIKLIIDATKTVRNWDYLDFTDADDPNKKIGSFWKLKAENFDKTRKNLYHYAIWGSEQIQTTNWSGVSNVDFDHTKVGDSFIITLSRFPKSYQTVQSQAATFVHELGHDLGQKHGGTNHSDYKPNYWSDMSYTWQLRSSQPDQFRIIYPTCTQIYYATPGALERNGQLPLNRNVRLDYSEGMGRAIINNKHLLDGKVSLCGLQVDWSNANGTSADRIDMQANLNTVVEDIANWPNLRFDGPRLGGLHKSCEIYDYC